MSVKLPTRGLVFWPVGTGDSTTVVVDSDTVLQVDIRQMGDAQEDDDPHHAVIDELVDVLPKKNGRPYLSVFALTHPDQDHCQGFPELLDQVTIGELWFTPRIFREYKDDLCDDATAFREEAHRRAKATIDAKGDPGAGDRVRIFGYDELLLEQRYLGFPRERLVIPGHALSVVDEKDYHPEFRAFVHAPFKDDLTRERNDTSLGLQVSLRVGDEVLRVLLLGDLKYPTLNRIFGCSKADDLAWNVLLAPHHCSKSTMYWRDDSDADEVLKQDILNAMEESAQEPGYVVSSSEPVPATNEPGDNPPHAKAKARYEEIVPDSFLCTQEHPDEENPEPIVFEVDQDGVHYRGETTSSGKTLSEAAASARGSDAPPRDRVGYGKMA